MIQTCGTVFLVMFAKRLPLNSFRCRLTPSMLHVWLLSCEWIILCVIMILFHRIIPQDFLTLCNSQHFSNAYWISTYIFIIFPNGHFNIDLTLNQRQTEHWINVENMLYLKVGSTLQRQCWINVENTINVAKTMLDQHWEYNVGSMLRL